MPARARFSLLVLIALTGCGLAPALAVAQEEPPVTEAESNGEPGSDQSQYEAVTPADPEISLDQLRIMVKPLTKGELQLEAEAWFKLLRQKAKRIAAARLGVKKTNEAMSADDQAAAQAAIEQADAVERKTEKEAEAAEQEVTESAEEQLGAEQTGDSAPVAADGDDSATADGEPAASEVGDVASAKKEELLANVTQFQEQRTAIADRLKIVLESLEKKGGEVETYRSYARAVSGIELDAEDASATWTAVTGWLGSKEGGQRWAWNIGKFVLVLVLSYLVAKFVASVTNWLLERRIHLSQLAEKLISRTIKNVIMIVGLVIALTQLQIDITPILAAIGAAGFIIGFALQGTLSNFASGLMILLNRPFDVGDTVTAGGVTGAIHEMNLVSTTFRTFDNQTIHVPNNSIWGNVITNITANDKRRVDLEFGIGYDDDFERAEQIIREVVESNELVLDDPEPTILLHELADSSVNIVCRPWAKTSDWWSVKTQITRRVKQRFDEEGITIPYPQTDIHVYQHDRAPEHGQPV